MLESNSLRDNRLRLIADDDKRGASAPFFALHRRQNRKHIGPIDRPCLENSRGPGPKSPSADNVLRRRQLENVLPMCQERTVTHVSGMDMVKSGRAGGIRTHDLLHPKQALSMRDETHQHAVRLELRILFRFVSAVAKTDSYAPAAARSFRRREPAVSERVSARRTRLPHWLREKKTVDIPEQRC